MQQKKQRNRKVNAISHDIVTLLIFPLSMYSDGAFIMYTQLSVFYFKQTLIMRLMLDAFI